MSQEYPTVAEVVDRRRHTLRVAACITPELHRAALAKSDRTGVPMSFVVRCALEQWVAGKWTPTADDSTSA